MAAGGLAVGLPVVGGLMLASYLICGIPFGLILSRALGHKDLRSAGSGNIGTTNALRVAGPRIAAATLTFDVLKGTLCVAAARLLAARSGQGDGDGLLVALVALAALYGHIFSPYLGFHGGKGIATGVGVLLGFSWPLALAHLAIFIAVVALTRYVSLGSVVTVAFLPLTVCLLAPPTGTAAHLVWILLSATVIWAHRGNIARLRAGTESKLSFNKRVTEKDDAS